MREHEKTRSELNSITSRIIGGAIALHEVFGPGLLESVYSTCLARDLTEAGLDVATDYPIGLNYKDVHIACAFRADIVVNRCVLVELRQSSRSRPCISDSSPPT
jgi:GxxExxY protein